MKKILILTFTFILLISFNSFSQNRKLPQDPKNYRIKMNDGELTLKTNRINYGTIFNDQVKTDTILIYNASEKDLKIAFTNVKDFIKVKVEPELIKPGKEAIIVTTFTASLNKTRDDKQQWGAVRGRFNIVVNDDLSKSNRKNGKRRL